MYGSSFALEIFSKKCYNVVVIIRVFKLKGITLYGGMDL